MIEDFREAADGGVREADLCIVGAGPAGLAIAHALAGTGIRVCVIEGGGLRCESDSQALTGGVSVGEPGLDPGHSRLRVYGGSCRLWGGGCIPLAPPDFEPREWVPHSGWPIRYADLEPWYRKARDVCGLDGAGFEQGSFERPGHLRQMALDPGQFVERVFMLSGKEFGRDTLPTLARADNIHVLLHANVLELVTSPEADRVEAVRIGSLDGSRGLVRARFFVLATGGIENARLLLLSDAQATGGLGNGHDLVGRFFQDHPRVRLGTLTQGRLDGLMRAYGRELPGVTQMELCLSDAAQRERRLLACRARPFSVYAPPSPGIQALREVRACLSRRGAVPDAPDDGIEVERAVANVLDRGLPAPVPAPDCSQVRPVRSALRAGLHAGDIAVGVARRLRKGVHQPRERVEVMGYFEQAPNPDSRITLDDSRDALGLRRVRADWRLTELDRDTHRTAGRLFGSQMAEACGSAFVPDPWIEDADAAAPEIHGTAHHIGTTRMSASPRDGVVDPDCRVHGVDNLYVAGSSVFPTGNWAFPTFTIIALSLRLAEHVRSRLEMFTPFLA